jgi:hypothetical protein
MIVRETSGKLFLLTQLPQSLTNFALIEKSKQFFVKKKKLNKKTKVLPTSGVNIVLTTICLAMPSARAIRYKSGLPPANTLRAFRSYPYCFASAAATHIVLAAHSNPLPKPAQRVLLSQSCGKLKALDF